jgi:hypothetical protein
MSRKKPGQPESVLADVKKAQNELGVKPLKDAGAPTKFTP